MPTQELAALQCDPTTKLETWLFQCIGNVGPGNKGKKVYRRLPYNLVSYDGFRTQYVEPVTNGNFAKIIDGTGDPIVPATDGTGRVVDFKFFDARPYEVFGINDVDIAANNI